MNSLSIFITILVLGVVAVVNVAGLPSQDAYAGNSVGGGSPWSSNPSICARSEKYSRCDAYPMCQPTCDNYKLPIPCPRSGIVANVCMPGCICKEGFVRVAHGDQCIPIDKCEGRVRH